MDVGTMRAVDRLLGRPLAWCLTRLRKLLPEPSAPAPQAVRKVLFVKLSEMGALVLATPAFAEASRLYPNAETWLVCFDSNAVIADVAAGFPPERIVQVRTSGAVGTLISLLGAVRRLRRERFDVVIDLETLSRVGAVLTYLARAPVRAGWHRFETEGLYCGDLYTHRVHWNPYLHVAQSMVALVRSSAADASDLPLLKAPVPSLDELDVPRFEATAEDVTAVRAKLSAAGVPDGAEVLLVNPNSSDLLPLRRWPREHFAELCRRLISERPGAFVVLTGAEDERALAGALLGDVSDAHCVSLVGETSLRELLTLFTIARLLVSADSGPPHFAALTDIRGVTLFGPETPALYGPLTTRNTALSLELACSPCIHAWNRRVSTCTNNVCMRDLSPAVVAATALGKLES